MKKVIMLCLALALSGCATTWHNPHIGDVAARNRQLTIDDGYCTRVAAGGAPMPDIRVYSPGTQSYQISGTVNSYDPALAPTASNYYGTVQSTPSVAGAFTDGVARGMALGAIARARQQQDTIHKGCMVALGWTESEEEAVAIRAKADQEDAVELAAVNEAIKSNPDLAHWEAHDRYRWELAIAVDNRLKNDPRFKDATYAERFAEVARIVKSMDGGSQ